MSVHRPGGTRYVAYGGVVALVVMSVAITVALPGEIRSQVSLSQALTLYGCVAAMIVVLHGMGRSLVRVDDDGLEVLNGFRRHRVPWEWITGISYKQGAPWPTLITHDDERIMLFALQGSSHAETLSVVQDIVRRVP
ncbi:PH domain-containing protein [Aeromicrobium sp. CF4.19]|uniref:PH domain-containing protein n=1 Tax=Aeromicrobium sp. CF4.19 TaxID=3373082 RepID=UPI003EE4A81D